MNLIKNKIMSQITLADITKLRKATGAGMMDCKHAMEEANGDMDKAVDIIRKKGQLVASKRADREATEGVALAGITADGKFGAVVALNCETDFVAKNQDFIGLVQSFLSNAIDKKPLDLEALKNIVIDGRKVADHVIEKIGITGEKMDLSFYGNQLACVVGFNKAGIDEQIYKDVAMQVAAMKPVAVDKEFVSAETIEKERSIGREKAILEGKPENMVEKIAEGMLQKFFKESTLMNQEFIKDSKKTIRQYLQSIDKELIVIDFKRFAIKD
jgi:elongation factor Ts